MKNRKEVAATFSDLDDAQSAKGELERAGIHAKIHDDSKFQRFIFLSKPLACKKVLVREDQYEKARHVLDEAELRNHVLQGEIRCLRCGSPHVVYPQFRSRFITTTFFNVLFSLLHLIDKTFYCRDCHYTWPAREHLRSRTDILNWPTHRGLVKEERG